MRPKGEAAATLCCRLPHPPGIPPPPAALPAGAYPVFGKAFGKGGSRVPVSLPLDYAAVLTVCAALLGVVPNLLHSVGDSVLVLFLELAGRAVCHDTDDVAR